jgi:hypothetical protein
MSADVCILYYGLRFEVLPQEIESLETRSDWRIVAAKKAGLKYYWGNFGVPEERYLLFIGAQIGVFGSENQTELHLSDSEFTNVVNSVRPKLTLAGLEGSPQLYVHWQTDS